jgi:hypothetical protein
MSAYLVLGSIAAVAGSAEANTVNEIVKQGADLGNLSAAAIWALVALISVIGLVKLYMDKSKDDSELKTIIKDTTQAITKNTEVLEKLSDNVGQCPKK